MPAIITLDILALICQRIPIIQFIEITDFDSYNSPPKLIIPFYYLSGVEVNIKLQLLTAQKTFRTKQRFNR